MAVCDSKYRFTLVDIGDSGSQSDGSVFANSFLGHAIENDLLNIPKLSPLPNSKTCLPFVFVGDDAFGLKKNMMKPYPSQSRIVEEKVFDYRLSRARRIIENSFGIATARFRIFRRPINAKISTVKSVTKAVVGLHNFLMKKTTKVIVSIVLQIISTERKMIMLFLGTGNRNKTLFPFLKRC